MKDEEWHDNITRYDMSLFINDELSAYHATLYLLRTISISINNNLGGELQAIYGNIQYQKTQGMDVFVFTLTNIKAFWPMYMQLDLQSLDGDTW